ncbi:MAG: acyl-CoA synthetase [Thermoplasmatales archaeon B_DKE]|nr:MAG: acyl-CoA synthetase [Thermoplasmatales archaeon B_DKE]QRF75660.1 Acetyl-coenzyme A synthetase [Thermoplasmatales archaeon]
MSKYVYVPDAEKVRSTNIMKLAARHGMNTVSELYDRADNEQEWFWNAVIEDCNIDFTKPYLKVFDDSLGKMWTRWFVGGGINIVRNCVERYSESNEAAIVYETESGIRGQVSFAELDMITGKLAGSLKKLGVKRGDRIGIYMPLVKESIMALYSIMRIGAIAVPMFSGYGIDAVRTRVQDAGIKILFTVSSTSRKGRNIDVIDGVRAVEGIKIIALDLKAPGKDEYDFYSLASSGTYTKSIEMESEDPAIMLYTSGTTGKPKGTMHVHGGSFINIVKEVKYYMDFRKGDRLFWITDLGWMMGPWAIIGANALGGAIFVYDGAVDYPDSTRVWKLIENNGITLLGLSPTYVRLMKHRGIKAPMKGIRVFGSTGEPWDNESWMWLFEHLGGSTTPISNVSGGTDIIGCFLASNPAISLKPRCLYRGLGMNVSVFSEEGNEVHNEVGYLVSRSHCPSMTRGLWKDPERYREAYWGKFADTWSQGDWAEMDDEGYFYLYGRSDEVIKVSGKRIGPNEIENVVMKVNGVLESAATGIPDDIKGEAICVFYLGMESEDLKQGVKKQIENDLGKSFSPKYIIHLERLPKTKNGKIMRRILKKAFIGENIGDTSNMEDLAIINEVSQIGRELRATGQGD